MIPWWVLVPAFLAGIVFGVGVISLLAAGESDSERMWKGR